ncbi:MAG TPA: hypothetical protein VIM69_11025, partial [Opitutaceae bacterium]
FFAATFFTATFLAAAFFAGAAFFAATFFTAAFFAAGFFLAIAMVFSFRFQMRVKSNNTLRHQNPFPADAFQGARYEAGYSSAYAYPTRLR